jgi:hypothetical protein
VIRPVNRPDRLAKDMWQAFAGGGRISQGRPAVAPIQRFLL